MKLILLSMAVFAFVAPKPLLRAADDAKRGGEEKLVTWVEKISPGVFAERPAGGGASSYGKPLPPTTDGTKRWDVSGFLKDRGVDFGPGSEAILLEESSDLVVTNTPRQIEMVERVFGLTEDGAPLRVLEIEATLWEYDAALASDSSPKPIRFADLKKAAGNSLQRLDTISVITKSGHRCTTVSRHGGADPGQPGSKPAVAQAGADSPPATPKLGNAKGTELETETIIGPDGQVVDMQIGYLARLPRGGELPDIEVYHATNVSVVNKQDLIIYTASAPGKGAEKPRQVALVIGVRIIPVEEQPQKRVAKKNEWRLQEDTAIIEKARAGLPPKK